MWVSLFGFEVSSSWMYLLSKMIFQCVQVCYEYVAEQGRELYELVSEDQNTLKNNINLCLLGIFGNDRN